MEQHALHQEIILKKHKMTEITVALKTHFIGLDQIIDEVMGLVSSWYLFPKAQLRPMVINLWGMTGSGKTALVKKLVELLAYEKLYVQIDMGEFESDSATWFKNTLTDDLEFLHEQPCIMCMDEFQFARTLDNSGNELGKDKLRFVWDLIDNGKLSYIPSNNAFYIKRAEVCLMNLVKAKDQGVIIENGVVTTNVEQFTEIFQHFYFENYSRNGNAMDAGYFLSTDFVSGVYYLFNDDVTPQEMIKEEASKSDLFGIIDILLSGLKTRNATKELDLSKALIFILGNLDEAYDMSKSMNPDISADELHEATLKINLTSIKTALKKRFRLEQIARLGNNHVIYRAFKNAHFEELIRRELERVASFIREQFHFELQYDSSINELIYREGVFPAQGTRPVLTTIKNYIEAWFGKIVIEVIELKLHVSTVEWFYVNDGYRFVFKDLTNSVIALKEEKVNLKIDSLRKTTNRDLQAHTAVHEAGHAVLAIMTLRILPSIIVSKSAAEYADGFCMVNLPEGLTTREIIKKDIIISLGGYIAEKMIFGIEQTSSGVSSDIETATKLANAAIRSYAMGNDPITISVYSADNSDLFYMENKYKEEALQLIHTCEKEAEQLLQKHKLLLLKLSEYLTTHYKMEEQLIGEFVRTYSTEDWIHTSGFRTKEDYFSFEHKIQQQISELSETVQQVEIIQ
ncbi:MAG: hypothetical protein QE487_01975 [Fluviicola sp.]|nr:hypothetical protein [Fluviicola sp.]